VKALKLGIEKDKAGSRLVTGLSKRYRDTGQRPEITPEIFERISKYNRIDVDCLVVVDQLLVRYRIRSVRFGRSIRSSMMKVSIMTSIWFAASCDCDRWRLRKIERISIELLTLE
jgi:hypothetical protein